MIDAGRHNVLGVWLHAVDYEAAVARIVEAARQRRPLAASALAVHGVMTGVLDPAHRHRLNQLDLLVPDGQPVRWAMNLLGGAGLPDRVYGPTLMLRVCEEAARLALPIYLYGSQPDVVDALARNLGRRFPGLRIAGARPSRFRRLTAEEKNATVREIAASGAAITFVGLGCPRQEVWVYEYRSCLAMPVIAVGAAFDFHAGRVRQAPPALQRSGLEWVYRLVMEPRRLWKRYLLLNPLYLGLLILQASGLVRFDPRRTTPPHRELSYG
jgi:exopolysaccharide biosynthesis WecB/TagA/CpsF family protein